MRCHIRRWLYLILFVVLLQIATQLFSLLRYRRLPRNSAVEDGDSQSWGTCNNQRCNPVKDDMLNVHLVAHSHLDVGWLKTPDQYYTGQIKTGDEESFYYGEECVKCILDSVIPELMDHPERRFIFSEMAFFSRYWNESSSLRKADITKLIRERRLEFVTGGWCLSDSATTYYNDIIDQHTLGFEFINQHFGKCAQSKIGWHVDQFGHSREHSSLFAQMGFDAIFLGRISNEMRKIRKQLQTMEHIWNSSPRNLGEKASIFTHINYEGYYAPKQYIMEGWNQNKILKKKDFYIGEFIKIVMKIAAAYGSNHIQIEMGSDFGYKSSKQWFLNIDDLIWLTNELQAKGSKINVLYSTPSCYIHYVNKANITWPEKNDDYFPYETESGYWTGFYTSKGGLKKHIKDAGAFLQACKQLYLFAKPKHAPERIGKLKDIMAVLQHHDAITGTEKDHVVRNYHKVLSEGQRSCETVISDAYKIIMGDKYQSNQEFCPLLNISSCVFTETHSKFITTVYNPLASPVSVWIRLPVTRADYIVKDAHGNSVSAEILPLFYSTLKIPERRPDVKTELLFQAQLPALGFNSYYVESFLDKNNNIKPEFLPVYSKQFKISNGVLTITFDRELGSIIHVENIRSAVSLSLKQKLQYYEGDDNNFISGAYIFSARSPVPISIRENMTTTVVKKLQVTEIHQQFAAWASQVIRLYDSADYIEIEWTVGAIPMEEGMVGKEVISKFITDLKSHGKFYTDSNGREILERRRGTMKSFAPGNYYPVTSKIFIKDVTRNLQLTVLTDRCQGGSSLRDGQLELMLHRRTVNDDNLGVGEPLNEMDSNQNGIILRGKHYVFINTVETSTRFHREMSQQIHLSPTVSFTPVEENFDEWKKDHLLSWSALQSWLPKNVHLLTLDTTPAASSTYLLRLEHKYEADEDSEYSKPAEISLKNMFSPFQIDEIEELSLGANFDQSEVHRLKWKSADGNTTPGNTDASQDTDYNDDLSVTLHPMQIRTFYIHTAQPHRSFFYNLFR